MLEDLLRASRRAGTSAGHARPRDRGQRGSIAVVAAVALVALIGMAALVVDGGYLAMRRRALQGVADAAALSGGYSLPTSATAISQARTMATANGYTNGVKGATVTVNSPYASDSRKVEVIVQTTIPTFLGAALRINAGTLTARAVAKLDPPDAVIFAGSNACSGPACGYTLCVQGQGDALIGSGLLLTLADLDAYLSARVFWIKMAFVVALLANGLLVVRGGRRTHAGDPRGPALLRLAAIASLTLWFATTLLGAVLPNAL